MNSKATYDLDTVVQRADAPVAAEELAQLRKENILLRSFFVFFCYWWSCHLYTLGT